MQVSNCHNPSRERSMFDWLLRTGRGRRTGRKVKERIEGEKGERAKNECSWCGRHLVVCGELAGRDAAILRMLVLSQLGKLEANEVM